MTPPSTYYVNHPTQPEQPWRDKRGYQAEFIEKKLFILMQVIVIAQVIISIIL